MDCEVCNRKFTTKFNLNRHIQNVHLTSKEFFVSIIFVRKKENKQLCLVRLVLQEENFFLIMNTAINTAVFLRF